MGLSKTWKGVIAVIILILIIAVVGALIYIYKIKPTLKVPRLEVIPRPKGDQPISDIEAKLYSNEVHNALAPYRSVSHTNRCGLSPYNCAPNLEEFGPKCTAGNDYSYRESRPCIFLKLKEVLEWTPDYINDQSDAPEEMPEQLKKNITAANKIWVSCEGKTHDDTKYLGPVSVLPASSHGFQQSIFPITSIDEYTIPIVAIRFEQATRNVTINVICRAWAKNFPSGNICVEFPLFIGGYVRKEI